MIGRDYDHNESIRKERESRQERSLLERATDFVNSTISAYALTEKENFAAECKTVDLALSENYDCPLTSRPSEDITDILNMLKRIMNSKNELRVNHICLILKNCMSCNPCNCLMSLFIFIKDIIPALKISEFSSDDFGSFMDELNICLVDVFNTEDIGEFYQLLGACDFNILSNLMNTSSKVFISLLTHGSPILDDMQRLLISKIFLRFNLLRILIQYSPRKMSIIQTIESVLRKFSDDSLQLFQMNLFQVEDIVEMSNIIAAILTYFNAKSMLPPNIFLGFRRNYVRYKRFLSIENSIGTEILFLKYFRNITKLNESYIDDCATTLINCLNRDTATYIFSEIHEIEAQIICDDKKSEKLLKDYMYEKIFDHVLHWICVNASFGCEIFSHCSKLRVQRKAKLYCDLIQLLLNPYKHHVWQNMDVENFLRLGFHNCVWDSEMPSSYYHQVEFVVITFLEKMSTKLVRHAVIRSEEIQKLCQIFKSFTGKFKGSKNDMFIRFLTSIFRGSVHVTTDANMTAFLSSVMIMLFDTNWSHDFGISPEVLGDFKIAVMNIQQQFKNCISKEAFVVTIRDLESAMLVNFRGSIPYLYSLLCETLASGIVVQYNNEYNKKLMLCRAINEGITFKSQYLIMNTHTFLPTILNLHFTCNVVNAFYLLINENPYTIPSAASGFADLESSLLNLQHSSKGVPFDYLEALNRHSMAILNSVADIRFAILRASLCIEDLISVVCQESKHSLERCDLSKVNLKDMKANLRETNDAWKSFGIQSIRTTTLIDNCLLYFENVIIEMNEYDAVDRWLRSKHIYASEILVAPISANDIKNGSVQLSSIVQRINAVKNCWQLYQRNGNDDTMKRLRYFVSSNCGLFDSAFTQSLKKSIRGVSLRESLPPVDRFRIIDENVTRALSELEHLIHDDELPLSNLAQPENIQGMIKVLRKNQNNSFIQELNTIASYFQTNLNGNPNQTIDDQTLKDRMDRLMNAAELFKFSADLPLAITFLQGSNVLMDSRDEGISKLEDLCRKIHTENYHLIKFCQVC